MADQVKEEAGLAQRLRAEAEACSGPPASSLRGPAAEGFHELAELFTEAANEIERLAAPSSPMVREGLELAGSDWFREVLRLAKIGFYLTDGCASSYGDGYQQPRELSFSWEWQQSKPNTFGWEQLDADVEAFLAGFTEDGEPAPDLPIFHAIAALSVPTVCKEKDAERALLEEIEQRDLYHEWADKLAAAIADHTGSDIGEHSNLNNPWARAIEALEASQDLSPTTTAACLANAKALVPGEAGDLSNSSHRAFILGAEAADADWELEAESDDPHPDSCPSIQSDLELELWRDGYLSRLNDLRLAKPKATGEQG